MTHDHHAHPHPDPSARLPWYRTWAGIAGLGAVALVALYLSLFHVTHVLDALPFVLLLACPLMHLFMHGGHGGPSDGTGKGGSP